MLADKSAGPDAAVLMRPLFVLANVGALGLGILWATGLLMLYLIFSFDTGGLSWTFWAKMVFVLLLTILVIVMDVRLHRVKKTGDLKFAATLPMLGRAAGVSLLLVVVFAALTFNPYH
jgi:hypothetical protein